MLTLNPAGRKVILLITSLKIYIIFSFSTVRGLSVRYRCRFSLPAWCCFFIPITAGISWVFALLTEALWCNKPLIFHSIWQNTIKLSYKAKTTNTVRHLYNNLMHKFGNNNNYNTWRQTEQSFLGVHIVMCSTDDTWFTGNWV